MGVLTWRNRRRWVGVRRLEPDVPARAASMLDLNLNPERKPLADHCVLLDRDRIVFDPAISVLPPRGMRVRPWRLSEIVYGISSTIARSEESARSQPDSPRRSSGEGGDRRRVARPRAFVPLSADELARADDETAFPGTAQNDSPDPN